MKNRIMSLSSFVFCGLAWSGAAIGAEPSKGVIPNFSTFKGKSYAVHVGPDLENTNRVEISVREYNHVPNNFLSHMKAKGFPVENRTLVVYKFPARGCSFGSQFLVACSSRELTGADLAEFEIVVPVEDSGSGGDLHFKAAELGEWGVRASVSINRHSVDYLSFEGTALQESSLSLNSSVWIYQSDLQNGWFYHDLQGLYMPQ